MAKAFTRSVSVLVNGVSLPTKALCDTGAQTRLLISPRFANQVQKRLGVRAEPLDKAVQFQDYRQRQAGKATHRLIATFEIDGRRFPKQEFIITETGYDIFVGLYWMADQGIMMNCKERTLVWPEETPAMAKFSPSIELLPLCLNNGRIDPAIQKDIERRDEIMAKAEKKYQILHRSWRQPRRVHFEEKEPKTATLSAVEVAKDKAVIASLMRHIDEDPRKKRWEGLRDTLP